MINMAKNGIIPRASISKLMHLVQDKMVAGDASSKMKDLAEEFVKDLTAKAFIFTTNRHQKKLTAEDIDSALKMKE
jgi:histone H3/H4